MPWSALIIVYLVWGSTYLAIRVGVQTVPPFMLAAGILGLLLLTVGNGGLTFGEQSVESGLAALLVATVPLWMLAADRILNGRAITVRASVAIALGVIGVAVLARPSPAGTVAYCWCSAWPRASGRRLH